MNHDMPAYGLWSMVIINSLVFILFALHFLAPAARGWQYRCRDLCGSRGGMPCW